MKRSFAVFGATGALIVLGALFFKPKASADVPRLPASDSEILEMLATGALDPRETERARLGSLVSAHPDDLRAATALARLDIQLSRARSDPRYLGYAQAALHPWWDQVEAPPEVLVLRATIRQSVHDFDRALADLDLVVKLAPDNPQAWITRSVVLAVRGRYDEARASCRPLERLAPVLVVTVCETAIDAVTGNAGPAYDRLSATLARAPRLSPDENEWAISTLGEIALRLGRYADAEEKFKAALAIDPDDSYVVGAYADLLLDQDRAAEATKLVAGKTDNDGLLLRLALAEAKTQAPDAPLLADLLGARFDASHLRGDTVHRREEARYELGLGKDHDAAVGRALALARANWDVQREPWDVRILLEAALAAGKPAAAEPVLLFLDQHHLEDPKIKELAERVRKKRGS